jgi:hypothetical protein
MIDRPLRALMILPVALLLPSCDGEQIVVNPSTPGAPPSQGSTPPTPSNRPPTVQIYDIQSAGGDVLVGATQVDIAARGSDPDGDPLSYTWEFGDGEPSVTTGAGVSHVFMREGDIGVTVTVTDGKGGQAQATTRVPARKISGSWRVDNARHLAITAEISQRNGPGFNGTMSDGAGMSGTLGHPRRITLRVSAANGLCIPSGTYNGEFNPDLSQVTFPGSTCRNFSLVRQ